MASRERFPAIPEFYGAQPGPQVAPPVTDRSPWLRAHETAIPPTKQPLEYLFEALNDPRNAWMGIGPMAGAIKGARLIKPLVEANQSVPGIKAGAKSLNWSGSEQAAKILDFDPKLGHTTHPVYGGKSQTAESFITPNEAFQMPGETDALMPGQGPPTADEIVAAQNILKKLAQQGAPKELTLYRGGEPIRPSIYREPSALPPSPNTPIPATTDLTTATEFSRQGSSPLFEMKVPREDLLANIEKLQRGRGYREQEYLIPLRSFEGAQARIPFENPYPVSQAYKDTSPTWFSGAKVTPYSDLHEKWPYASSPQQTMQFGPPKWQTTMPTSGGPPSSTYAPNVTGVITHLNNGSFRAAVGGLQDQLFKTLEEAKQYLFETNQKLTQ